MRRTATSLAIVALMVTFSSGAALAAFEDSIACTGHTDTFTGTKRAERIFGLGGADQINGGGPDLVGGGQGSDELADGLGKDTVYGNSGGDNLIGQGGDTSLDYFNGGGGPDLMQPVDVPAVKDVVNCGRGTDTVYADEADVVDDNCERVRTRQNLPNRPHKRGGPGFRSGSSSWSYTSPI